MGSRLGIEKSAATKTRLSVEEWRARRTAGMRWCFRCRSWHPLEAFSIDRSRSQERTASCKACTSLASTASRYGLTLAELRTLLVRSGGRCELCGTEPDKLVVDHDHLTERVLGVLCSACNVGMGLLHDDPNLLRKAVAYIERGRGHG